MNIVQLISYLYIAKNQSITRRSSSTSTFKKNSNNRISYQLENKKKICLINHKQRAWFQFARIQNEDKNLINDILSGVWEYSQVGLIIHGWDVQDVRNFIRLFGCRILEKGLIIGCRVKEKKKEEKSDTFTKQINYVNQLKQFLMEVYRPEKVQIFFSDCSLTLLPCNSQNEVKKVFPHINLFKAMFLVSWIDQPKYEKHLKSLEHLEESIRIRDKINSFIQKSKEPFTMKSSLKLEKVPLQESVMVQEKQNQYKTKQKNKSLQSYTKVMKNLEIPVKKEANCRKLKERNQEGRKLKYEDIDSLNSSINSSESERSYSRQRKRTSHLKNPQKKGISTQAQNIHLKWVINVMQSRFEEQSKKYQDMMNKKIESIQREKNILIKENNELKRRYEQQIGDIDKLKKLQSQLYQQNEQLKKELDSTLPVMEAGRQLRLKLEQREWQLKQEKQEKKSKIKVLEEEVQGYACVCSEMKGAYESLQRKYEIQKTRCGELELRILEYEKNITEIINLPTQYKKNRRYK